MRHSRLHCMQPPRETPLQELRQGQTVIKVGQGWLQGKKIS
jgi:hypothetical protein